MAPGLHVRPSETLKTGAPESTSILACAEADCPIELEAVKLMSYLPSCCKFGVHSNLPVAGSNRAPAGILVAATRIGSSIGSMAWMAKETLLPGLAIWFAGTVSTGTADGVTWIVSWTEEPFSRAEMATDWAVAAGSTEA